MPAILKLGSLIAILLPASKIAASIFSSFGILGIIGELVVGIITRPSVLNRRYMELFSGEHVDRAFMLAVHMPPVALSVGTSFLIRYGGARIWLISAYGYCVNPVRGPGSILSAKR